MGSRRIGLGIGLSVLVAVGAWLSFRRDAPGTLASSPEVSRPMDVVTFRVARREAARTATVMGTVQASLTAELAPKVTSRVVVVTVREGDRVRAGQVLARLEAADLAAQVRQGEAAVAATRAGLAQAQTAAVIQRTQSATRVAQAEAARRTAQASLTAAQAQLSLVREGSRSQQKLQADAALRQAEAGLRTAQATHDRFRTLVDDGAVSRQQYDEVALQLEVARSQHETARQQALLVHEGARPQEVQQAEDGVRQAEAHLRQAEAGVRMARAAVEEDRIKSDQVRMLRAQLRQAEANLDAARVQHSYTTLAAPFAGVVLQRRLDPGALATPETPILSLVDPSRYRFEAVVPERQIGGIRLGMSAGVAIDAMGQTLAGRVTQIVPGADPAGRSFLVKLALPPAPGLAPGLFGRAQFAVGTSRGIRIPETALWRQESLAGVLLIEDGIAHRHLVTTGALQSGEVEVLSGLKGGELIVARDADRVPDGASVRVEGSATGGR